MNAKARKFPLGTVVATSNALDRVSLLDIHAGLDRHGSGDWGNVGEEDRLANEEALAMGERLVSAYSTEAGVSFLIITERDRSITTVLMAEDY